MTVASLWKVLDRAGCGIAVGADELVNRSLLAATAHQKRNPWNYNELSKRSAVTSLSLAIDLSIWICESLTSQGMAENNLNPSLHLVFTRTIKLLQLGMSLIFVIEGKRRIRDFTNVKEDQFRKRRCGTAFWNSCNACEEMLKLLGVTVVRAKAEGEALCALLNQRGIVDAVISNDSDCFLYGAKLMYKNFSIENMENARVIKYEHNNLQAIVDGGDDNDVDMRESRKLRLSRYDLISFALLTGSDLVGTGLSKIGHKKAIRFIRKCQIDCPLSQETASLDEITAWANAAKANRRIPDEKIAEACCSRCTHPGSKRNHQKFGCEVCGTQPGEECFLMTTDDRFRRSLRSKALAMLPKFDPANVFAAYMRPNDCQLPMELSGLEKCPRMRKPNLTSLIEFPKIIKGRCIESSRSYVKQAVCKLLARIEMFSSPNSPALREATHKEAKNRRERPYPSKLTKALIKNNVPSYEVVWIVNSTTTDREGRGVDGYEFVTSETQQLINEKYPSLVLAFQSAENENAKQGDEEQNRRKTFLEAFSLQNEDVVIARKWNSKNKRQGFFKTKMVTDYRETARKRRRTLHHSDDVGNLLRFVAKPLPFSPARTMVNTSLPEIRKTTHSELPVTPEGRNVAHSGSAFEGTVSNASHSSEDDLLCNMGGYLVTITPVESNHGKFPPRSIFVRQTFL